MNNVIEQLRSNIRSLEDVFNFNKYNMTAEYPKEIKNKAGIYGFWWIGNKSLLIKANRAIGVLGPNTSNDNIIHVTWDWNMDEVTIPLYIGKSTNIDKRVRQHLMLGTPNWYTDNKNMKTLNKKTAACQFRSGFEHLFKKETLEMRKNVLAENIGFSFYIIDGKKNFIDRFYIEDYLIGYFRPWFNLDSER